MTGPARAVVLDRQWLGKQHGWTVAIEPPCRGEALGGSWPEYQDAALYASQLARSRGWSLIRRGEVRQGRN
jgi:hypothetical protein